MKTRMVILGILAALAIIFVVLIVLNNSSDDGDVELSACQDMIVGVRNGDAEGTYSLFSESAQAVITTEDWQTQVDRYKRLFAGGTQTPWLIDSTTEESTEEDAAPVTTVRYRFDSVAGEWDGVCQFFESDNGLIASFVATTPGQQP